MMNFSWQQAETLDPGKLAIEGIMLATKTWKEFVKFVLATLGGFLAIAIVVGIWNAIGLPLGGFIMFLLMCLFGLATGVGGIRLSLAVIDGKKLTLEEIFSFDGKVVLSLILATVLYYVLMAVGFVVLIVPGLILALGCSFYLFILVEKPGTGVIQSLKASWAIANGDLLNLALLSTAVSILTYLVILPVYEIGGLLFLLMGVIAMTKATILSVIPGLLLIVLGAVALVAYILIAIGCVLAVTMAYKKLSTTRASVMAAALKS